MAKWLVNAAGRRVPHAVNGEPVVPFRGIGKFIPRGRKAGPRVRSCTQFPKDGNKVVRSLREALIRCGVRNGMTVSTHHHLRNGDGLSNMLFLVLEEMGIRNIRWMPSASFPVHEQLIPLIEDGTIHHIEGSMNGGLGRMASLGHMRGTGVLRSHGGRYQAIQDGEARIDIAVLAAPTADPFGNANGVHGKSACGPLGFGYADSMYADHVIVVTDNLVTFPCVPWHINGNNVDAVVEVNSLGDPAKIVSGTTEITRSPDRLLIARYVARFVEESGILKDGFSFQAGAGGISLAFTQYLREAMLRRGVRARFARGGGNKVLVGLLEEGMIEYLLDGQCFDLDAVRSLRENPHHVATSPFTSYNYHGKGNFASLVDVAVLGATEVDLAFNANVVTHSDGYLLHGIGGWQDCLFAGCTILAIPSMRDRVPVIVDSVTTLCGPGELIDVVITERGIAINPRRKDLQRAVRGSSLPLRKLSEMQTEINDLCGGNPAKPSVRSQSAIAVIKWVDGTVLDTVYEVRPGAHELHRESR